MHSYALYALSKCTVWGAKDFWRPDNSCLNPQEVAIIITSIILLVMSLGGLYYAYKGSRLNSFLDFRLLNRSKKVHGDKVPGNFWCKQTDWSHVSDKFLRY